MNPESRILAEKMKNAKESDFKKAIINSEESFVYDRDYEKEFNCVKQAASKNCIVNYQKWDEVSQDDTTWGCGMLFREPCNYCCPPPALILDAANKKNTEALEQLGCELIAKKDGGHACSRVYEDSGNHWEPKITVEEGCSMTPSWFSKPTPCDWCCPCARGRRCVCPC